MRDVIVTTPRREMATAAAEAQQCIEAGGGYYFRTFRSKPQDLFRGSKVFYVENGYIRGFGTVERIHYEQMRCGTTGRDWGFAYHAIIPADSWKWVHPIPMKGFQGWRYFDGSKAVVVGGWRDPRPDNPVTEMERETGGCG